MIDELRINEPNPAFSVAPTDASQTTKTQKFRLESSAAAPVSNYVFGKLREMFDFVFGSGGESKAISHAGAGFDALPPELLRYIFGDVGFEDLLRLQLVSKKCHVHAYNILHENPGMEDLMMFLAYKRFTGSDTGQPADSLEASAPLKGATGLKHVIGHNRELKLSLGELNKPTTLTAEKFDRVMEMLKSGGLSRSLTLEACNMPQNAATIFSALADAAAASPHLSKIVLDLSVNATDPRFQAAQNAAVEFAEALPKLGAMLQSGIVFSSLGLDNLAIGPGGAQHLGRGLKKNCTLVELNMAGNDVRSEGAGSLAEALKSNSALTWLDLSVNEIGDDGIVKLAEALQENPGSGLQTLGLFDNLIGTNGLKALARLLETSATLTNLDIGSTSLEGTFSADDLMALLDAVKQNTTLTSLGLTGLFGAVAFDAGDWTAGALLDLLAKNKTLEKLWVEQSWMGEEALIRLIKGIPADTGLTFLSLVYSLYDDEEPGQDLLEAIADKEVSIPGLRIEIFRNEI